MTYVVGLGCQRGCEVHTLLALFDTALAEAGIDPQCITALASIDREHDEPGLLALARHLNLPLECFNAEQLAIYERPAKPQVRRRVRPHGVSRHRRKCRPGPC